MVWADFEEKEFEIAFCVELGSGANPSPVFSSGAVAEKVLGYDAAANPEANHRIWEMLTVTRPKGLRLLPRYWSRGGEAALTKLPSTPISLILQYKRPEFLRGGSARQWDRWRQPYYRFTRYDEQHAILRSIESKLGPEAIVRYASPAFHSRGEYEYAVMTRLIIERTGFVAPSSLGKHKVWTYREPGIDGYPNPSGRWIRFDSAENLFQELLNSNLGASRSTFSALAPYQGFDDHLARLANAVAYRRRWVNDTIEPWERQLRASRQISDPVAFQRLVRIVTIQTVLSRIGASWHFFEAQ